MPAKKSFKQSIIVFLLLVSLVSCGGSKRSVSASAEAKQITDYAQGFINTPYQYGGTSRQGMDCSGLIYQSFLKHDVNIPRTSKNMSKIGRKVKLRKVAIGDLLFFKSSKKWFGGINHVGLVVSVDRGNIQFIHSTTSRGVTISRLDNEYWSKSFRFAKRVLM